MVVVFLYHSSFSNKGWRRGSRAKFKGANIPRYRDMEIRTVSVGGEGVWQTPRWPGQFWNAVLAAKNRAGFAKWIPKSTKMGTKIHQVGPKIKKNPLSWVLKSTKLDSKINKNQSWEGSWGHLGPKRHPRGTQEGPRPLPRGSRQN